MILVNGALGAYISRGARQLQVFLPEDEPARSTVARAVAGRLAALARAGGLLIAEVNGIPSPEHPIAPFLVGAGFVPSGHGLHDAAIGAACPDSHFQLDFEQRVGRVVAGGRRGRSRWTRLAPEGRSWELTPWRHA